MLQGNAVFQIELKGIGRPAQGALNKAVVGNGYKQHGTPCENGIHGVFPTQLRVMCSISASTSAVCSPNLGAGRLNPPGLSDRRGIMLCMGTLPNSSSSR